MFTKEFGKFVCEGDSITCVVETLDGIFDCVATVYRDECGDKPDERQDGFWPSRDPKAAGYVKPVAFEAAREQAFRVWDAWCKDEWFYCGVCVTVAKNGVTLTKPYDNALWGVECNYPDTANEYLRDVANELLDEALIQARGVIAKLCGKESV